MLNVSAISDLGFESSGCCTLTRSPASFFFSISLAILPVVGVAFSYCATILSYSLVPLPLFRVMGNARAITAFSAVLKFAICRSAYSLIVCSMLGLVVALDLAASDFSSEMLDFNRCIVYANRIYLQLSKSFHFNYPNFNAI